MNCPKCHQPANLYYAGMDQWGVIREYACFDCDWHEGDEMDENLETKIDLQELLSFVRLVATPKRSDGTYNYCREALEEQAKELLEKLNV